MKYLILVLFLFSCRKIIPPPSPSDNPPEVEVPIVIIDPLDENPYYKRMNTTNAPTYRDYFSMEAIDDNRMVIFGGKTVERATKDFYIFSIKENTWSNEVAKVPAEIEPRFGAESTMIRYINKQYMFVWGGARLQANSTTPGDRLNNGFLYDVEKNDFIPLPTMFAPGPRIGHEAVTIGEYVLVWGGEINNKQLNDGAFYNMRTSEWLSMDKIDFEGQDYPEEREEHHIFYDSSNSRLLLYGGRNNNGVINDVWQYKFNLNEINKGVWTKLGEGSNRLTPDSVFDEKNQKMFVYGGSSGELLKNGAFFELSSSVPFSETIYNEPSLGTLYNDINRNQSQKIISEGDDYYFFAKTSEDKHAMWQLHKEADGYKAINIYTKLTGDLLDDEIGRFYQRVGNSIVFWGNRSCTTSEDGASQSCATKNGGVILKDLTNYE